jgi:hypothetical protein
MATCSTKSRSLVVDCAVSSTTNFAHQLGAFDAVKALNSSASTHKQQRAAYIQSAFEAASNDADLARSARPNKFKT